MPTVSEYGNPTIMVVRPDKTVVPFTVDIACSGIYSLIGFIIFAAFIAYIARERPWKKAAILSIGFPLIVLLNITRITIILGIGYNYGEQLALQVFHFAGGWALLFLGTLTILLVSEKILKTTRAPQPCQECDQEPDASSRDICPECGKLLKHPQMRLRRTDMAKIATIGVALILLLYIQAPVFALTQGPAQILIQTPSGERGNTQILPQIQGYNLTFIYRNTDFEQEAKQDASLVYAYVPNTNKEQVWATVEIASSTTSLHRWETCLIT